MKHIVDIKLRDKYVCVCQKENCDAIKMPLGNPCGMLSLKTLFRKQSQNERGVWLQILCRFPFLDYSTMETASQELKVFSSHACGILNHRFGKCAFSVGCT